jgi:hypothetical protein
MDARYKNFFPNIIDVSSKKTSDENCLYNCIAWAFKDSQKHWWPNKRSYWPIDPSGMTTIEAFEAWFTADGWEETTQCGIKKDTRRSRYTPLMDNLHMLHVF